MKPFFLYFFLFTLGGQLLAQPLGGSSKKDQLIMAIDSAIETNNWVVALDNLKLAGEQDEDDLSIDARSGQMNFYLRDIATSIRDYKRTFRKIEPTDTTFNEHRYYYGRALKMDQQPDEALTQLTAYVKNDPNGKHADMARLAIKGITLYRDQPAETSEVAMEILDRKVNTQWSEYSPVLSADGQVLYFATVQATEPVALDDANEEGSFVQIMSATKDGKGEWGKAQPLDKEVNRPGVHSANPSISADGRRMYFNRLRMEGNEPAESKIYVSDADDTGWKSANPVSGINGDDHLAMQPAVGELFGREVLFFVSDMEGGYGGYDIYYADYQGDGSYGTPVNLGETINTSFDDMSPFYFDGTLYFSSEGYPSMGGFDLFYSAWNGSAWSEPANMGPGINSTLDDRSLSVFDDGLVGFMTSNRPGGRSIKSKTCCDDIYGFRIASLYANLVVGLFSEERQPLSNGTIELQPIVNDEPDGPGEQKTRDDGNRFDFGLELKTLYEVVASHPGYYPDTVQITTLGLKESKDFEQVFFLKLDPNHPLNQAPEPEPEPEPEIVPVFDTIAVEEAVVLENILYDFDKSDIRPEAEGDLQVVQQIMEQYPEMVIELSSHTDNRGNAEYNQQLSKNRANAARKWLIINGDVSGPRIKVKGYGKEQPQVVSARLAQRVDFLNEGDILDAAYINALPTEEQQERAHELNRRTEFKVLEGPEELIIRRDVIEREFDSPQRNSLPVEKAPAPPAVLRDAQNSSTSDTISPFSTLYGRSDTDGLPFFRFDKRRLDLGTVPRGETRTFSYTFTNASDVPAKIMLIQACECTRTEHDEGRTYQPGERGTIDVVFDSTEKEESETITIDIFLEQEDSDGRPILEMVEYTYELQQ